MLSKNIKSQHIESHTSHQLLIASRPDLKWLRMPKNWDFKEIPGYQVWRDFFKTSTPLGKYETANEHWEWAWFYFACATGGEVRRAFQPPLPLKIDFMSQNSAFKPYERKLVHPTLTWQYKPSPRAAHFLESSNICFQDPNDFNNDRVFSPNELSLWYDPFIANRPRFEPATREEDERDVRAFRSLVFMYTGIWNPVDEERMRNVTKKLRRMCLNVPIFKLFNFAYIDDEQCVFRDYRKRFMTGMEKDIDLRLSMLFNKMTVDIVMEHDIIPFIPNK